MRRQLLGIHTDVLLDNPQHFLPLALPLAARALIIPRNHETGGSQKPSIRDLAVPANALPRAQGLRTLLLGYSDPARLADFLDDFPGARVVEVKLQSI